MEDELRTLAEALADDPGVTEETKTAARALIAAADRQQEHLRNTAGI